MKKVSVRLKPIVSNINLPTVIKTAILPGESVERLFIATQTGEIYHIYDGVKETFINISSRIIKLGSSKGGYDERGLVGLAFHPQFYSNGLFYLHYSLKDTQGPGALSEPFKPNPCNPRTLNLKWINRETKYDHIDTVEEWVYQMNREPKKKRTLLNLRRPFANHNGVNSLSFSPESKRLILTTGDGGSGFDPFNLSQNNFEIAGKIIEIDLNNYPDVDPPIVTRFDELPTSILEKLNLIAKGVRNSNGVHYQKISNQYIKYVANVGQDLCESIYAFNKYESIPAIDIVNKSLNNLNIEKMINFGWRGWEGILPTSVINPCNANQSLNNKIIAYYNEAVNTSSFRLKPLISYFHEDLRPNKFNGNAITGIGVYMGNEILDLNGSIIFTDFVQKNTTPVRGVLAYTTMRLDYLTNDFSVIDVNYDFKSQPAYFVSLGNNSNQTKLYLGVYGSSSVTNLGLGSVYEIIL